MDHLGGIDTAIALVKQKADIPEDEEVTLREVSMDQPSLQQVLASGGASSRREVARLLLTDPAFVLGTFGFAVVPLLLQVPPLVLLPHFVIAPIGMAYPDPAGSAVATRGPSL